MATPRSLFTKGLDEIASRHFKHPDPTEPALVEERVRAEMGAVAEALLVAPRVTFKVYGENLVVPLLCRRFGVRGVEALLKERALEFVLWQQVVTYLDDEELLADGLSPLQYGELDSPAHADPEASVELGLRGWGEGIGAADARRLTRLVAERTVLPPPNVAQAAVTSIVRGYESGHLRELGFDPDVAIHRVDHEGRRTLASFAERTVEASVMWKNGCDLYGGRDVWQALTRLFRTIETPRGVLESAESALEIERLPSVPALLERGALRFDDVVRLRHHPRTEEFRRWLWSQPSPGDKERVAEAYLSAMAPAVELKDRAWFKAARISVFGLAGSALGAAIGASMTGTLVGLGVSLLDGFAVERLLARANPRRFATDVIAPLLARSPSSGAPG